MKHVQKEEFDDYFVVFRQVSEDGEFQISLEHHAEFETDPHVDKAVAISEVAKLRGKRFI